MDLLLRNYGLEHGKSRRKTRLWDNPAFLAKNPLAGANLSAAQASSFKSQWVRNLFFALDRPDVHFASKAISWAMAQPTINADETLKGLARCYLTAPRPATRKSSGCTHLMLGRHPIFVGTTTQAVISLSSGDKRILRFCGACRTLGLVALLLDFGFSM